MFLTGRAKPIQDGLECLRGFLLPFQGGRVHALACTFFEAFVTLFVPDG